MPVPSAITDLSTTLASNSPAGSDNVFPNLDDYLRAHAQFVALLRDGRGLSTEVSLASASTCDIGGAASMFVQITGTTTITSFGTNYQPRVLRFAAALTLTHNASTLILPTGANITTAAGDTCMVVPVGTSGWRVLQYQRASEGADFVSFLQAGSGAASRTVQSKLRDVVSVLDFGADPTGAADSTTAIQAALDAHPKVYLPAGSYKLSSGLVLNESMRNQLVGDGPLKSILKCDTNAFTSVFVRLGGRTCIDGVKVEATGAVAGTGIRVADANEYGFTGHIDVRNVYVTGFSKGIDVNNIFNLYIGRAEVANCTIGINLVPSYSVSSDSGYFTTVTLQKCYVYGSSSYGIYVSPTLISKNLTIQDCAVEANTGATAQIKIVKTNPLVIINCYSELVPASPAVLLDQCVGSIRGYYFNGTGGLSLGTTANEITVENFYGTSSTDILYANGGSLQVLRVFDSSVPGTSTLAANKLEFVNSSINGAYYRKFSSNLDLTVTDGDLTNTSRLSSIVALKRTVTATINANTTTALIADAYLANTWNSDFTVGVANLLDSYNPGLILTVQCASTGNANYINVLATNTTGSNITITSKALRVVLMKGTAMAI